MKTNWGVGLILVAAACGGETTTVQSASAPTNPTPAAISASRLSLVPTTPDGKPFDVAGPAFARYSPDSKQLTVSVFDAVSPTPDCSMVGPSAIAKLSSGTIASLTLANYPGTRVGTFPIVLSDSVRSGTSQQTVFLRGKVPDQTTLEISSYDAKTLVATAKDPRGNSVATINAQVCPDGDDALQKAMSATAAQGTNP